MFSGWTALRSLTESIQQFLMEVQKMEHGKALDPARTQNPPSSRPTDNSDLPIVTLVLDTFVMASPSSL